jgi:hypothetical protein
LAISTQKGLRTLNPELVVFEPDGTAYVGLDLSALEEGAEFVIIDVTEEAQTLNLLDLLTDENPDEPEPAPLPEFIPRFVDHWEPVEIPVPGYKSRPLHGKECYEARTDFERIEQE